MTTLITAGQLAKLASTTKRTIQFYDQKGVLKPVKINSSKYRQYEEHQVLDYQKILLLSKLGISLSEIKAHLDKKGDLSKLFNSKKTLIKNEIERLQFNLDSLERYLDNLKKNGTMVNPEIKVVKAFNIYYIERIGSYSQIGKHCEEFGEMFEMKGKNFTTLTIFDDQGYRPKESHMKICAIAKKDMRVKKTYKNVIKKLLFNPAKVISYTYYGSGDMLSLFWKELEKYCKLKGYETKKLAKDYEIYWEVNERPDKQRFEIARPIC